MEKTPKPPPPAQAAGTTTSNHHLALENFKSFLMKCASSTTTPTPASSSFASPQKTFIEERIRDFFPTSFPTPDHPPYAWMVESAIKQLNEERGSSVEAISNFMLKEYKHLPWAHAALLKYHLRKLSESSILAKSREGNYMIGKASITPLGTSKLIPRFTCTTSPNFSPSPSLSASCSSSFTCASSVTSDSSQHFNLKRMKKNIRAQCCSRGCKGWCRSQGHARNLGGDWDWSYDPSFMKNYKMKEVHATQLDSKGAKTAMQFMMVEVEAAHKNILGNNLLKGQIDQNSVNIVCQSEQGNLLIEIDPSEQQHCINNGRIELLQLGKAVSEHGSRRNWPHGGSVPSKHASQAGSQWSGSNRRVLHMDKTGKYFKPPEATEMESLRVEDKQQTKEQSRLKEGKCSRPATEVCLIGDDNMVPEWLTYDTPSVAKQELDYVGRMEQHERGMLDELIEEVYMELMETTKESHQIMGDEACDLQVKQYQQVKGIQGPAQVECRVELSTMVIELD